MKIISAVFILAGLYSLHPGIGMVGTGIWLLMPDDKEEEKSE